MPAAKGNDKIVVEKSAEASLPTEYGLFKIFIFHSSEDDKDHIVLMKGEIAPENALVRIHSQCVTGDSLFSKRCDCGPQLELAMKRIHDNGQGLIIYLRQEGRGIGLVNKIKAYALQDQGLDTAEANEELGFEADQRGYATAATILKWFGIKSVKLMTNNPLKMDDLKRHGIAVAERVPLVVAQNVFNAEYMKTKKEKLGHLL